MVGRSIWILFFFIVIEDVYVKLISNFIVVLLIFWIVIFICLFFVIFFVNMVWKYGLYVVKIIWCVNIVLFLVFIIILYSFLYFCKVFKVFRSCLGWWFEICFIFGLLSWELVDFKGLLFKKLKLIVEFFFMLLIVKYLYC